MNPVNPHVEEPDLPKPPIWAKPEHGKPSVPASPPPTTTNPAPLPPAAPQPPTAPQPPSAPLPPTAPRPLSVPRPPAAPPTPPIVPPTVVTQPVVTQPVVPPPAASSGSAFTSPSAQAQWPAAPPAATTTETPVIEPEDRKRSRGLLIGLAALLLVAAVVAGGFFFGRSVGSDDTAVESDAQSQSDTSSDTGAQAGSDTDADTGSDTDADTDTGTDIAIAQIEEVPGPIAVAGEEPVVAVARAVAPAVVLITHEQGQGSGIIYDESGLLLTNAHVVADFTQVTVTLASGVRVPGEVLGADPLTDVAVIRIDADAEFGVAVLAPDSSVEVGQLAVAIGSPFGLDQTVTSGVISATGRVLQNPVVGEPQQVSVVAMHQTDAPINPGNSGGALADREGRVIGMNTSIRTDGVTNGNIGVGFAIPSDTAKLIADRIVNGEPLEQGFLGIGGETPLIGEPGAVVTSVTVGSGAEAAGLLVGDRIFSFDGVEIQSITDLAAAVRLLPPEATIVVDFERDGTSMTASVTLGVLEGQ